MSALPGLLRDCAERPDDDTPRLILADWLDDNGDEARAESVRAQIRMSHLIPSDPRHRELLIQVIRLQNSHLARWLPHPPAWFEEWDFRRGLLHVATSADALAEVKDLPECIDWIGEIRLHGLRPRVMARLADSPILARVPVVNVSHEVNLPTLRVLLECSWLDRVHSLNFRECSLSNKGAVALAGSPRVANLRYLYLPMNRIGPVGVLALARSPYLAQLEVLDLDDNGGGFGGIAAMLTSPQLTRLRSLSMTYNRRSESPKHVTSLPVTDRAPSLTSLDLLGNHLGPRGTALLAASPLLSKLTSLDLSVNYIDPEGARSLASSPHLASLTKLHLYAAMPGDEGIDAITRSPHLTRLTDLMISMHGMNTTAASARSLVAWPGLAQLTRLIMNLDAEGATILAGCPHIAGLRELNLSYGKCGDAGARALASSPSLGALLRLNLIGNGIGPAGALALARSDTLRSLRWIQVGRNDIGVEGGAALRQRYANGAELDA